MNTWISEQSSAVVESVRSRPLTLSSTAEMTGAPSRKAGAPSFYQRQNLPRSTGMATGPQPEPDRGMAVRWRLRGWPRNAHRSASSGATVVGASRPRIKSAVLSPWDSSDTPTERR